MNKAFAFLFVSTAIVSPGSAFTSIRPQKAVRSIALFQQKKASWSEYKDQYVEPNLQHGVLNQSKEDAEKAKEAHKKSDAYWAWQFEQDLEKLHIMEGKLEVAPSEDKGKLTESWSHYKHDHIDNLPSP